MSDPTRALREERCPTCRYLIVVATDRGHDPLCADLRSLRRVALGRGIGSDASVAEELRGMGELLRKDGYAEWASHLEAKADAIDAALPACPACWMDPADHKYEDCPEFASTEPSSEVKG